MLHGKSIGKDHVRAIVNCHNTVGIASYLAAAIEKLLLQIRRLNATQMIFRLSTIPSERGSLQRNSCSRSVPLYQMSVLR